MNNKKRSHPQRAVRTTRRSAGLRGSLEAKLLKFCADIGWICGWRAREQVSTLARDLAPFNRGVPLTYVEYEGPSRLVDVYGKGKLARLRRLKKVYDPHNRLRYNANIPPAR